MSESDFKISEKLEELARSSNRFSYHVKADVNYEQEYTEVFTSLGLSKDEIKEQLYNWELSRLKAEHFYKNNPKYHIIHDILEDIQSEVADVDTREPDYHSRKC